MHVRRSAIDGELTIPLELKILSQPRPEQDYQLEQFDRLTVTRWQCWMARASASTPSASHPYSPQRRKGYVEQSNRRRAQMPRASTGYRT